MDAQKELLCDFLSSTRLWKAPTLHVACARLLFEAFRFAKIDPEATREAAIYRASKLD